MPVLHTSPPASHVRRFELPSTGTLPEDQRAWVEIDVGPSRPADWLAITDQDTNLMTRTARIIVNRITAWNFIDDKDGSPVPITFDNFWCLPDADRLYLLTISFDQRSDQPLTLQEKKT